MAGVERSFAKKTQLKWCFLLSLSKKSLDFKKNIFFVGLKQMKKCFIGSGVLGVGGFSAYQPLPGPKNESFFCRTEYRS